MKVLYIDWPCFGKNDVLELFERRGYEVTSFYHPDYNLPQSQDFMEAITEVFQERKFDFCFSYNYLSIVAQACYNHATKYLSFTYDSPIVKFYSYTVTYPTNYIFSFDSYVVDYFNKNGLHNFYYMPLPVNIHRAKAIEKASYDKKKYSADISFVGSLYDEEHNLLDRLTGLSDYTKGYIDGIIQAQSKVYGYYFIEECLNKKVIDDLQANAHYEPYSDGTEPLSFIFSDYFVCRKMTSMERYEILSMISKQYDLKLYTKNSKTKIENAKNMGYAEYNTQMPYVFHDSKINLNISLRSIKNGIPLRCMDIMACGGFLLSNFQNDFLRHFELGKDMVCYESREDLMNKIDYYLCHEDERMCIAQSGYEKIVKNHNYDVIFDELLNISNVCG